MRPVRYIKLTSEVPGRILEIFVNAGDQVNKGQALVRVDPTQLQSSQEAQFAATQASINDVQNARNGVASAQQSLVVAEAAVSQARQQTVSAEIDLKTAERELKRATNLVESNVMSRSEYDAARDRYDQAKAKMEAQNIAVKEAIERANQQRVAVKEAQTSVKSSESRANQQQAILRGQSSQREKATQYSPLTWAKKRSTPPSLRRIRSRSRNPTRPAVCPTASTYRKRRNSRSRSSWTFPTKCRRSCARA